MENKPQWEDGRMIIGTEQCTFMKANGKICLNFIQSDEPKNRVRCNHHRHDYMFASQQKRYESCNCRTYVRNRYRNRFCGWPSKSRG